MLFPKLWHGTVVQRLPCKAMSQSFAWNFRAKAALQSIFVSYRIELSCIELLLHGTVVQRLPSPKLPVKLLRGTVVQKLPCEAISWAFAWNCRAKVASWSYFLAFAWKYAKAYFRNYFWSFYVELSCKSCLSKLIVKLWFGIVEQKLTCKAISQVEMLNSISRMLRCALK